MPITTATLGQALSRTPEEQFTAQANSQISDHITRVCDALTTEHQRDPDRIKRIADHANTTIGTYEKQKNISAEADRLATAKVANAGPLITQIMVDLNRSGLTGSGRIDPIAFKQILDAALVKDLKTAIENTLTNQYKGVIRQEKTTDAQREQDLHQHNRKLENIAASARWWTRASIIGGSVAAVAGLTTFVSGNIFAAAIWAFPVGAAAAVAWFVLPPVVGWIRKQLQPPFQPRNTQPNQNPNNPPRPNPPQGPNTPPPGPNNPPGPNTPPPGPNTPPRSNTPPPAPTTPTTPPGPLDPSGGSGAQPAPSTNRPKPPVSAPTASPGASVTPEEKTSVELVFVNRIRVPRSSSLTDPATASAPAVKSFSEEDL